MKTSAALRTTLLALTLCHLLAASWSVAADENSPDTASPTTLTAVEQIPTAESGDVAAARVDSAGILSFLVPGIAWPFVVGMLLLAAVNGRKQKADRNARS